MPHEFRFSNVFDSQLKALAKDRQEAVKKKIEQIRAKPEHFDFLHKAGGMQKARVGKYRIFFRMKGILIEFIEVRKRDIAYKR
jgi:mRNA-degrading endonuclease RelE of RelBE toxin-antitoxin system